MAQPLSYLVYVKLSFYPIACTDFHPLSNPASAHLSFYPTLILSDLEARSHPELKMSRPPA